MDIEGVVARMKDRSCCRYPGYNPCPFCGDIHCAHQYCEKRHQAFAKKRSGTESESEWTRRFNDLFEELKIPVDKILLPDAKVDVTNKKACEDFNAEMDLAKRQVNALVSAMFAAFPKKRLHVTSGGDVLGESYDDNELDKWVARWRPT